MLTVRCIWSSSWVYDSVSLCEKHKEKTCPMMQAVKRGEPLLETWTCMICEWEAGWERGVLPFPAATSTQNHLLVILGATVDECSRINFSNLERFSKEHRKEERDGNVKIGVLPYNLQHRGELSDQLNKTTTIFFNDHQEDLPGCILCSIYCRWLTSSWGTAHRTGNCSNSGIFAVKPTKLTVRVESYRDHARTRHLSRV